MIARLRSARPAAMALMTVLAVPAFAQVPAEHYWYDGGQRRPLRLDPARVADFGARGGPMLQTGPAAVAKALDAQAAGSVSPVFQDGGGGPARALPGGMLVTLRQPLDDAQARAWFSARGLTPVRRIGTTATWLVQTAPGLAALKAANALHEGGEVAGAEPNWWQQRALK